MQLLDHYRVIFLANEAILGATPDQIRGVNKFSVGTREEVIQKAFEVRTTAATLQARGDGEGARLLFAIAEQEIKIADMFR